MRAALFIALLLPLFATAQEPAVSREAIIQTVEHMRQLAKDSEQRAATMETENKALSAELEQTQYFLDQAQEARGQAQQQVDAITKDRNEQAAAKDEALIKADYWHTKHSEAVAKLWWWRLWGWAAIIVSFAVSVGYLLLRFTNWGARTLGPIVAKAVAL